VARGEKKHTHSLVSLIVGPAPERGIWGCESATRGSSPRYLIRGHDRVHHADRVELWWEGEAGGAAIHSFLSSVAVGERETPVEAQACMSAGILRETTSCGEGGRIGFGFARCTT